MIVCLLLLGGCGRDIEEQVRIHDGIYEAKAILALQKNSIEYRIDQAGAVWFKVKDREIVRKILDEQLKIATSRLELSRHSDSIKLRNELDLNGIKYEVIATEEWPFVFMIPPESYNEASQIFSEITASSRREEN